MNRRKFLGLTGRASAGLTLASPILDEKALYASTTGNSYSSGGKDAPTLARTLDTGWIIAIDPDNIGRKESWFRAPRQDAKKTRVPSVIQESFPGYHGVAWYWLEFAAQSSAYTAGRYLLRFNAVDYLAEVWLNGVSLGTHEGGETPFIFDITEVIRVDATNHLSVRVLNPKDEAIDGIVLAETAHRNKVIKFQPGSLYDFGGIISPVELYQTPAVRLTDLYADPDWKTGSVKIQATTHNSLKRSSHTRLHFVITEKASGQTVLTDSIKLTISSGDSVVRHQITIKDHHLWQLDDPYLYRLGVTIEAADADGTFEDFRYFGFRDFRVVDGYFRMNGKRLFLRCTHTGNHVPFGQVVPPSGYADLLRRDMLYAKASGFNAVRFISGVPRPYQLDLCDELGLLIYEESSGSWLLKDSPQMKRRYEDSVREMILRDRNHPCVAIWGMLNETEDGPVFREAQSALSMVRSLDESRLLLLSSGRFDGHLEVGSVCNPRSLRWEHVWGKEAPGAGKVAMKSPSGPGIGDFHLYPRVPQSLEASHQIRTLGQDSKPVFLSEYGIGSMMDVIHEAKMYEQAGIPEDAEDFVLIRSMADHLIADWSRFGMDSAYPDPETLLRVSQQTMARHRTLGFNDIRSNPKICGFNLTGMLDHAMTGEGVWRFWRDWKPGAFDAMQDGWAPVRWCLFAEPTHTYTGRPVTLEAVLANEDVLRAGDYPVRFRVWGPNGTAWERETKVTIQGGEDGTLAVPVLKEEVLLTGTGGDYKLIPYASKGFAPPEASWQFHLTDPASLPRLNHTVVSWGLPQKVQSWLQSHGAQVTPIEKASTQNRNLILVGDLSKEESTSTQWKDLATHMVTGSTVVFLSHLAFARGKKPDQSAAWFPAVKKGRIYEFWDWLYHKECVAKPHAVFEGLQGRGLLDWYYYGPMLPHFLFDGQDTPDEVIAAAFATGYSTPGGYASGILLGSYKFGTGQFIVNTFPILDHIDNHPVADRLLLNLIEYSAKTAAGSASALPPDFDACLREIGYL
jgi:hypothetical protein